MAKQRGYQADESVSKQRLCPVDGYEQTRREADDDTARDNACDRCLESAEAMQ
ncbi:MAG: hypothetical protein WBG92_07255 [Thiohalocapsa sp.]